jgi:hypothetical protein
VLRFGLINLVAALLLLRGAIVLVHRCREWGMTSFLLSFGVPSSWF